MRNKMIRRVLALCLAACLCLSMTACFGKKDPSGGQNQTQAPLASYTVEVKTEGGMALEKIGLFVYADEAQTDMVAVAKTDENGVATFEAPAGNYFAALQDVPEGYLVENVYPITGETTAIVLKAQLVEGDLNNVTYKLGGVMQDFAFTAADGKEYKLSELLKTKKAVMLNFWYLNCQPCKQEFPYLQEAYALYSDSVEVLAMNPVDGDDAAITAFAQELGLTFPMGKGDPAWEKAMQLSAYPTTVIIDRFGSIALIHKGTITNSQTFTDAFAFFSAEDYVQTVVEDIEDLLTQEVPTGTADNPTELGGVTQFELTVEPGKTVYVDLYKVNNVWMQIGQSDIYVEYDGKTYTASGGSVGLLVTAPDTYTPAKLGFGNSGNKTLTFTVYLSSLAGSMDNPYTLSLGDFRTNVNAGNDQGVYYDYTAPEDGTLTVRCLQATAGVDYDFSLYNLNSYAMRMASETPAQGGYRTVSVQAKQGQRIRFSAGVLPDSSHNYPAASFEFQAEFDAGEVQEQVKVEKIGYAVTVTDENRKPLANVAIRLNAVVTGDSAQTDMENTSITTDEKGVASIWLPKGEYDTTLIVPKGYTTTTTQFKLTEQNPTVSVKMDTVIDTTQTYTVRVIDDTGAPLENVLVSMGEIYGRTDGSGTFSASMEKGAYTAVVGIPNGYTADTTAYPFPADGNYLTVTLTKLSPGEQPEQPEDSVAYTVKVVDASGNPVTGILVNFKQNGAVVASAEVDETGTAVTYLPAGEYTAALVSAAGTPLSYDENAAGLSESKTTTTITVAADISKQTYESEYWGNYLIIGSGSTNVDLNTDLLNYNKDFQNNWIYVFTPNLPGVYRFTAGDGAEVNYWGSPNFPGGPIDSTSNANGYFEVSVRASQFDNGNQPGYVIGVTGSQETAVITISRMGDVAGDLPVEVYQPKTAPAPFTLTESGTPTYVDITKPANVEKRADGYYLNGKKLYINLGPNAPYLSFYLMLGVNSNMGTGLKGNRYNENGEAVVREDYTQCMTDFAKCIDGKSGLYPLTEDIVYMVQSAGKYLCWWDIDNPNYLFEELPGINTESAWLFACCYFG